MNDLPDELKAAHAQSRRPCRIALLLALAVVSIAHAADPLTVSFTSATKKPIGGQTLWQVPAPSGASMVIKAAPNVLAQTKNVTLTWKGFETTDQVFPTPPPGPLSVLLSASGQATVPIVFGKGSHKQWKLTACTKWQPPGNDHKIDDCVYAWLEGVDQILSDAGKLIKIVSPAHPGLLHNWVKIPNSGNSIGVSVRNDVLAKSADKVVRLIYSSESSGGWPGQEGKTFPKTLSLAGATSAGGWVQKSEQLALDPNTGEWLHIKACLTLEYSGEVCSNNYAYRLTYPAVKPGLDKAQVIDASKIPPLPPQDSAAGSQTGQSGDLPVGKARTMAPPPMLGVPAVSQPGAAANLPQIQPAAPTMAPVATPPAMQSGRTAPSVSVPGCSANPGVPGQFACATAEAYAGCERLRGAGSAGVRACQNSGGRLRR